MLACAMWRLFCRRVYFVLASCFKLDRKSLRHNTHTHTQHTQALKRHAENQQRTSVFFKTEVTSINSD